MKYPLSLAKSLVQTYCQPYTDKQGRTVYIKDDSVIVSLPAGPKIDFEELEMIAIEQLQLSPWEFDYWLGQNLNWSLYLRPLSKTKASKRPKNYEKKLELDPNVEFDGLFKVAVYYNPSKRLKATLPKKKAK